MKLKFDKKTLDISSSKVITGVISIKIANDKFFPEEFWNDSIIIILNSWILNIIGIINEECDEARFNFLDGPFSFTISRKDIVYTIQLFQDSKYIESYYIDINELGSNLIKISQETLKEADARGWQSR